MGRTRKSVGRKGDLRICPSCGGEYVLKNSRHAYCSIECSNAGLLAYHRQLYEKSGPGWEHARRKAAELYGLIVPEDVSVGE